MKPNFFLRSTPNHHTAPIFYLCSGCDRVMLNCPPAPESGDSHGHTLLKTISEKSSEQVRYRGWPWVPEYSRHVCLRIRDKVRSVEVSGSDKEWRVDLASCTMNLSPWPYLYPLGRNVFVLISVISMDICELAWAFYPNPASLLLAFLDTLAHQAIGESLVFISSQRCNECLKCIYSMSAPWVTSTRKMSDKCSCTCLSASMMYGLSGQESRIQNSLPSSLSYFPECTYLIDGHGLWGWPHDRILSFKKWRRFYWKLFLEKLQKTYCSLKMVICSLQEKNWWKSLFQIFVRSGCIAITTKLTFIGTREYSISGVPDVIWASCVLIGRA